MANLTTFTQPDGSTRLLLSIPATERLPFHPDLRMWERVRLAWLILLGRLVNISGPFLFDMTQPPKEQR